MNRKWDTLHWRSDAAGPYGQVPGSGGDVPFPEPETLHLSNWLLELQGEADTVWVIVYHSAVPANGMVLPGYGLGAEIAPPTYELAQAYAATAGYDYSPVWVGGYPITGEFVHWLDRNGFVAIDVELPNRAEVTTVPAGHSRSHIETNWAALLAVYALMIE